MSTLVVRPTENSVSTYSRITETPIHNFSVIASQLCKYSLSLSPLFGHSGSDSRKLCNPESFHVQLLDHRADLTSRSLPFHLFHSPLPPEVVGDRWHGWVMSALSLEDLGLLRDLVRLGSGAEGEDEGQWWQREGKNSSLLFYFVCFFNMSVLKRETQDISGELYCQEELVR